MNIAPLNLFKFLSRPARPKANAIEPEPQAEPTPPAQDQMIVEKPRYTMVDAVTGGRKVDLMVSGHMSAKHIELGRAAQKTAKARWHTFKNEQSYSPREVKLDKQLEFNIKRSGLNESMDVESTEESAAEQGY